MGDLLAIGRLALLNTQNALDTTGHNVANVNTDGYSRQRVESASLPPRFIQPGYLGQGVGTEAIIRQYDDIIGRQIVAGSSAYTEQDRIRELTSRLDQALSDPDSSLGPQLEQFFASLNDLSNEPTSLAVRQDVLVKANTLVDGFHRMDTEMRALDTEVSQRIDGSVDEINRLAARVGELNEQIAAATGRAQGRPPNDLLDKRDQAVKELAEQVGISTVMDDKGLLTVMMGQGQTLVQGLAVSTLETIPNDLDPQQLNVVMLHPSGDRYDLTHYIQGGELGGLLAFRDEVLNPARNALGRSAVALAEATNAQHLLGMDLNGNIGGLLFSLPAAEVIPNQPANNIDVTIDDVAGLSDETYRLEYDGANWQLTQLSDGQNVILTPDPPGWTADGIRIEETAAPAAGDVYLIRPTRYAPGDIKVVISDPREVAAAAAILANVATDGNGIPTNRGTAVLSDLAVGGTTALTLPLATPITLTYDAAGMQYLVSAPPGGTIPYDPATDSGSVQTLFGGDLAFSLNGIPIDGDSFVVATNTANSGDNRNALALARLQETGIVDGGTVELGRDFANLLGRIGSRGLSAQTSADTQEALLKHSERRLDEVAGVNLDEEAGNLVRFQQAYGAAAQLIRTADETFQSLLAVVG